MTTAESTQDTARADTDIWAPTCPAGIHRPSPPPPPFRFLDLPGEMQNRIADEFITTSEPIVIHMPRFNRHPSPPPKMPERPRFDRHVPPTPPLSRSPSSDGAKRDDPDLGHTRLALMLTCRKLYREHWRTYYGENLFDFNLDTFGMYLEQMPQRCTQQIRRVRFRMPHKYYHDQIWTMLAGLKRLEEVELVLCPPSQAEDVEYEHAREGVKRCKRLLQFSLVRSEETDEPKSDEPVDDEQPEKVAKKDSEVQAEIRAYLDERECKRRQRERSRSRPARSARDGDFPTTEGEPS